ncbi:hypothetical protein L3X38_005623 [Prunus dulcis]|uniref:Uncharacterized protein n=1 Tax=Prunus dulcis TaxID=3755 RepID=A0AAD4ZRC3_PRUDU|nr:hypothetical protein L3X38_005623 [Prunus dulcis]
MRREKEQDDRNAVSYKENTKIYDMVTLKSTGTFFRRLFIFRFLIEPPKYRNYGRALKVESRIPSTVSYKKTNKI